MSGGKRSTTQLYSLSVIRNSKKFIMIRKTHHKPVPRFFILPMYHMTHVQVPGIKDGSQRCLHRIDRTVNLFQISDSVTTMAESFITSSKDLIFGLTKKKARNGRGTYLPTRIKLHILVLLGSSLPNLPCDRDTRSVHERGQLESHAMRIR